jgi:hypothetical protein
MAHGLIDVCDFNDDGYIINMEAGIKAVAYCRYWRAINDVVIIVIGQKIAIKIKMHGDDMKYTLCITHFTVFRI